MGVRVLWFVLCRINADGIFRTASTCLQRPLIHANRTSPSFIHTFLINLHKPQPPQYDDDDDDQWRYSPDRALASLTGFMIVFL
jgi:hypothetical protein